jgi:hypothetical protein
VRGREGLRPEARATRARNSVQIIQIKASKTACIRFHFLSFIFPNRDFSKGYERKEGKVFPPAPLAREVVHQAPQTSTSVSILSDRVAAPVQILLLTRCIIISIFVKTWSAFMAVRYRRREFESP